MLTHLISSSVVFRRSVFGAEQGRCIHLCIAASSGVAIIFYFGAICSKISSSAFLLWHASNSGPIYKTACGSIGGQQGSEVVQLTLGQ